MDKIIFPIFSMWLFHVYFAHITQSAIIHKILKLYYYFEIKNIIFMFLPLVYFNISTAYILPPQVFQYLPPLLDCVFCRCPCVAGGVGGQVRREGEGVHTLVPLALSVVIDKR